jgi:hypothetical protein
MATGISADPILFVMFHPKIEEVIADYVSIKAPVSGNLAIAPKAATLRAMMGLFIYPAMGRFITSLGQSP